MQGLMLHERELLSPSGSRNPTVPHPVFCELVVNGNDCPSWHGSLVEFKIWLNKSTILS